MRTIISRLWSGNRVGRSWIAISSSSINDRISNDDGNESIIEFDGILLNKLLSN